MTRALAVALLAAASCALPQGLPLHDKGAKIPDLSDMRVCTRWGKGQEWMCVSPWTGTGEPVKDWYKRAKSPVCMEVESWTDLTSVLLFLDDHCRRHTKCRSTLDRAIPAKATD